ncbi:MAG: biotin/lipoate A/B protein ligase family protein [Gemmataceae bacterium]
MDYLNLTLPTLAENLALDEALLLHAEAGAGGEVLRSWEWPAWGVVLGAGGKLAEDVDERACLAHGVSIHRRASGGGTVLLGPGCLAFTLILNYQRAAELDDIRSSYGFILDRVRGALADAVPGLASAGISDLAIHGRKCSGNSQQRKRHYLLHHGTLLYDFAVEHVAKYLRMPQRQPEYRHQRGHADFLTNLPLSALELRRRLRGSWQADVPLDAWPEDLVRQLVAEKYSRPKWVRRR